MGHNRKANLRENFNFKFHAKIYRLSNSQPNLEQIS